ncbi:PhnD/SsuA/transferrin family substrate-binding protein [Gymnodinialimonas sp. 2305UL16-5]|uniref:phosphate/phosphite/phosphonate ABC transporter substrate-binding protein n=1 Tax=Gymnodinialimonas mytili TaxID=3126503 RepID=UPI0030A9BA3D
MFASLPMYLAPDTAGPYGRLWARIRDGLRDHGIAAPDALDHDTPPAEGWARDDLILGQICNLPLRLGRSNGATLIGTCDHGVADVPPGHYASAYMVHRNASADDPMAYTGGTLAINDAESHSGWGAPQTHAASLGHSWRRAVVSGAHRNSAALVAEGTADIAAIDLITLAILRREDHPALRDLRMISQTPSAPGMTLITRHPDPAPFRAVISDAIATQSPDDRAATGLRGLVTLPDSDYTMLSVPPAPPLTTASPA